MPNHAMLRIAFACVVPNVVLYVVSIQALYIVNVA
jgi:hypothetical protein